MQVKNILSTVKFVTNLKYQAIVRIRKVEMKKFKKWTIQIFHIKLMVLLSIKHRSFLFASRLFIFLEFCVFFEVLKKIITFLQESTPWGRFNQQKPAKRNVMYSILTLQVVFNILWLQRLVYQSKKVRWKYNKKVHPKTQNF